MMSIFFITGTSGSGKTTLIQELKSLLPTQRFAIYDFDENGVPENADQDWRIITTSFWINKAIENSKHQKTTIICGVSVPSEVIQIINNNHLPVSPFFGFIKINDDTIKKRLLERNWSPQLITDNINWAHYLEEEVKKQKDSYIVENINITIHELAEQFVQWIKQNID